MRKIAFIGLGTMGFPMAGHLSKARNSVNIYNRTTAKADNWLTTFEGSQAYTPAEASAEAETILLCAGRDADVRQLICGPQGILATAQAGSLVVDHTTTSAQLAEEMKAACAQKSVRFADAPVSGGQQGAENGQLSIMVGADVDDFADVKTVTEPYTKSIAYMGPVGNGQKTKMVNQICIAGLLQGLAEGLNFAQQSGLNPEEVIQVISAGAAGSWQMTNRSQTMIDNQYDHGFALDWMCKDLRICLDESERNDAALPVTALVHQFYRELQSMGCGRQDTSALLKRLQKFQQ